MLNSQTRSAHARLFAIVVMCALIPAWCFYIGIQYSKTVTVLEAAPSPLELLSQK
ncbi:MAG: hypothetical protein RJB39_366 [Candidatus Parcubacteria bacterium]|jgi:hypothetical protein